MEPPINSHRRFRFADPGTDRVDGRITLGELSDLEASLDAASPVSAAQIAAGTSLRIQVDHGRFTAPITLAADASRTSGR